MDIIFDLIYGKDPTKEWIKDPGLIPEFDLSKNTLRGIKFKEPYEKLSGLGRAENRKTVSQGQFSYYSKGLEFGGDNGFINYYMVVFNSEAPGSEYKEYSGELRYNSQKLNINYKTTEKEFIEYFGEPYWRDDDLREIILFYEFGEIEWQVEFDSEKKLLTVLTIITPPLLSKKEQRENYGITKPWPY